MDCMRSRNRAGRFRISGLVPNRGGEAGMGTLVRVGKPNSIEFVPFSPSPHPRRSAWSLGLCTGRRDRGDRWIGAMEDMPWMVILFGIAVGPLGLVSIFLVISQPMLLHAWCTLCLFSALISLIMIGPAMDEVAASLQFLRRSHEQNRSVWNTFWHGGVTEDRDALPMKPASQRGEPRLDSAREEDFVELATTTDKDGLQFGGTWNHLLVMALGVWLMAASDVMGYEGPERVVDQIAGPLVVSMAIIAMAEVTRSVRWVNVALGLWLMLAPVLMGYKPLHIGVHSALIGGAILLLSLVKGPEREQTGGGWGRVWTTPLHTYDSLKQERQWKKAG
jgi:general stress protein CsbA